MMSRNLKMIKLTYFYMFLLQCFFFFSYSSPNGYAPKDNKHYIVYMGHHSFPDSESLINANHKLLASYIGSVKIAQRKIIHHYHRSFRGFSALLTPMQAKMLKKHSSIISVFESQVYVPQTTRTWDFLLEQNANQAFRGLYEQYRDNPQADVVIGHLDTGVWPELANFDPSRLGPPPSYYNSKCYPGYDGSGLLYCNNKIVGFRFYDAGYQNSREGGPISYDNQLYASPRDDYGHGTHTASTAAGGEVNYDEYGSSALAQGGAPYARLAVYKTCWHNYCEGTDILKAFDDAIGDNVDIITVSLCLKGTDPVPYFSDVFAVGSLHAFLAGKLVVAAGCNNGDYGPGTVRNAPPWVLTVAATSIDRDLISNVVLGNGQILKGYGYNPHDLYGNGVVMADNNESNCNGDVEMSRVKGKVVVCFMGEKELQELGNFVLNKSSNVERAGGIGMILVSHNQNEDGRLSYLNQIPTSVIGFSDFQILQQYINSINPRLKGVEPTAGILSSQRMIRNRRAPKVASYSGKGPNPITPDIIKPDIAAPGSAVLAGWPDNVPPPPNQPITKPPQTYEIDHRAYTSGTSMACPHIAGVAAVLLSYLKSSRSSWTPAAIKSALMTTATNWDNTGNYTLSGQHEIASPFDYGSGHVVPDLIFNPGLVYDMPINDLNKFVCSEIQFLDNSKIYNDKDGVPITCSGEETFLAHNLNYPSIAINGLTKESVTVTRQITRLEEEDNTYIYRAIMDFPDCVGVLISPETLNFAPDMPTITYTATFENLYCSENVYGSITWTDGDKRFVKTTVALIIS